MLPHGAVLWFVEKPVPDVGDVGEANVNGTVRVPVVDGLEPRVPIGEDEAAGAGSVISGLTPALPISTDPSGIPVREAPLGNAEGTDAIEDATPVEAAQGAALSPNIPPPTASPPPS
jgi:hypothetical protein